jgi:hypothetical protein
MEALYRQEVEGVKELDIGNIIAPVVVVLRAAATAIIDTVDVARSLRMPRQITGEAVEVAGIAGEAGKADHAPVLGIRRRIVADIQSQIVKRRIEDVSRELGIKLVHRQRSNLGSVLRSE